MEQQSYPLAWPPGWRRSTHRERARFGKRTQQAGSNWTTLEDLTVYEGIQRILTELERINVRRDDIVISTNMAARLDGLPRSDARAPADPGVAVYWRKRKETRCMAVDRYDRVADNMAAIAATLDAMRAIERHGGAVILERAFIGFKALPAPEQWWQVLGLENDHPTREQIEEAYRAQAMKHHPDRGGETWQMARINEARARGIEECTR